MVYMREEGEYFTGGIKKCQGSEIANSSMKILIALAEPKVVVTVVEERSRSGLSQQFKSPPKIRKCEDISGNLEKKLPEEIWIIPIGGIYIHQ